MAAGGEISLSPLGQEGLVIMDPRDVVCTACNAAPSEPCTTMSGIERPPHAPRVQLAEHPDICGSCGAGYGEPCRKVSGTLSMYPHRARLRAGRNTEDIAWTT